MSYIDTNEDRICYRSISMIHFIFFNVHLYYNVVLLHPCYILATSILHLYYIHTTSILHLYYIYTTSILHLYYRFYTTSSGCHPYYSILHRHKISWTFYPNSIFFIVFFATFFFSNRNVYLGAIQCDLVFKNNLLNESLFKLYLSAQCSHTHTQCFPRHPFLIRIGVEF